MLRKRSSLASFHPYINRPRSYDMLMTFYTFACAWHVFASRTTLICALIPRPVLQALVIHALVPMVRKKKVVDDGSQRSLFSCSNFALSSQQAAASGPSQQPAGATAENRDANVSRNHSAGGRAQQSWGAQAKLKERKLVQNCGHDAAELEHAVSAMAQQTAEADSRPQTAPADIKAVAADRVTELLGRLNAEQQQAASAPASPPVFLLAGAGTGKTTTLIARVWSMMAQGIFPRVFPLSVKPVTKDCLAVVLMCCLSHEFSRERFRVCRGGIPGKYQNERTETFGEQPYPFVTRCDH